tara:strand:+ start:144 stop:1160 length:1017 start_codon:yes stop_codon:yes gene_type:complete
MFFVIIFILFFSIFQTCLSGEINLYTTRHYEADYQIYKKFQKKTGIKVNVVSGKSKPLEKRIIEEGKNCKGDLFFLADAGRLYSAEKKGLFQKIKSSLLVKNIPSHLRNDYWYGITKRARIVFYNPEHVNLEKIKNLNYEDLGNKEWKNSIAIRQSNNVYNQSLVASLIHNLGEKRTSQWLENFVKNFYEVPSGNDRAQILAVAAGEAKLAIANTYYYALMLSGKKGKSQQDAAKKVKPLFPNKNNRGAHINISGIGVLKHSPNKINAIRFLEFLVSEEAQTHLSENSFEYPVVENINIPQILESISIGFKEDKLTPVEIYGKLQTKSFNLMLEKKWN